MASRGPIEIDSDSESSSDHAPARKRQRSDDDDLDEKRPPLKKARTVAVRIRQDESLLVSLPDEMRAHIASFLGPSALARLSQTCKSFEKQLKLNQNGPLYYPYHWRLRVLTSKFFRHTASFHKTVRLFLLQKARLHIFDGLMGAQSKLKLAIEGNLNKGTLVMTVGGNCVFSYTDGKCTALPSPADIAIMKAATREKHKEQIEKNRRNRAIPLALREERTRLKEEVSTLTKQLRNAAREMRHWDMSLVGDIGSNIATAERFAANGRRRNALQEELEDLKEKIEAAADAQKEEEEEKD